MKPQFAAFFVLLFCFTAAQSQNQDYLVTTKGDTLKGTIRLLTYDRLDRLQLVVDKNKTTYTALQVKSLFKKGEHYRPMQIDNTIQFMKVLKDGYLSLLAFRIGTQTNYDGRYLAKKDGTGMEVPNLGFKKNISAYMEDCPDMVQQLKEDKFNRADIEKVVEGYNQCIDQKTKTVKQVAEIKPVTGEKADAINSLRTKVSNLENFSEKQDVLDLLNDISEKLSRQQNISNYQLETLKNLLKEKGEVTEEAEKVVALLKAN